METDERRKTVTPYHCHICNIYCASYVNLQTHFLGNKHKMVEEVLKSHCFVKSGGETIKAKSIPVPRAERYFGKTLEEQLNSCKDTEPAIGLQYITEYRAKDLLYECNLCGCQARITNMFMHVLGAKHKLAYLARHYPEMPEITGRGTNYSKKLKKIVAEIEQKEGRQKIMLSMETPVLKDDSYSVQASDSLVTWFSEDDKGVEKKKEEDNSKYDEDSDKMPEKTKKPVKPDKEEQKDQDSEQLAFPNFSDSDSEEIHNNEDYLDYLKTFEIMNEDDATFILKVTQKLTNSLVTYRQKVLKKKNTSKQTEGTSLNAGKPNSDRKSRTGAEKTGFSEKQPHRQYTGENKGTKRNDHSSNKRKASLLNVDDSAKSRKHRPIASTVVGVPSEKLSSDVGTQPSSSRDHRLSRNSSSQNQSKAPMTTIPGPSASEKDIIAEFFNSIRNMEFDEVADTLHRIAALNPLFTGMDVQNVLKILTDSGCLKLKHSGRI